MAHLFKTVVDLNQKNREVIWDTLATVGDKNAHTFAIGLRSDNRSVDLANARVQLLVRRADKKDRIITGSVSDDNYAVATLDEYCYEITGRIRCTLLISVNGATLTGVRATLTVEDGLGDVVINPAGEIPNLQELLAEIDGMRQATAAANTAAKNANDAAAMIEQIRADIESAVNEAKEAVEEAETAVSEATTAIKEAQKITTGWANAQTEAESVPSDSPAEVNMGLDDEGNRILIFKIPKGQNGLNPHIGANGHWFVGNVDTGIKAKGDTGDDGITPHIGTNGNWFIGSADTGVRAQGPQGAPGTGSGTVTGVVLNGQTYVPNNLGVIELPELGGSDVELSDSIPSALGQNASAGTGSKAAREDHVHKMPSASDTGALGKNERAVDSAKLAGKEPSHYENKITSITANGQAVQPDENGTVNLGTIGRSNLEIDDTTPSAEKVYSSQKVEGIASQLSEQIENVGTLNLLVNSNFQKPYLINLNAASGSYEAWSGEKINKWWVYAAGVTFENFSKDGVTFTGGIYQNIDTRKAAEMANQPFTFAVKTNGTVHACSGVVTLTSEWHMIARTDYDVGNIRFEVQDNNEIFCVIESTTSALVEWAVLYEGEYTSETLPTPIWLHPRLEMLRMGLPVNPPNLLDNSYWKNPEEIVNQRGLTEYTTTGWTIDRWRNDGKNLTIKLVDGGLSITNKNTDASGGAEAFTHRLGVSLKDGAYTVAVCIDGNIYLKTTQCTNGQLANSGNVAYPKGYFRVQHDNGLNDFRFFLKPTYTAQVQWAAIYEGAYTLETMPPYVQKPYSVELAECQRYFYRHFGALPGVYFQFAEKSGLMILGLPSPMRKTPVGAQNGSYNTTTGNEWHAVTLSSVWGMGVGGNEKDATAVRLNFTTVDSYAAGSVAIVEHGEGSYIDFSCDL